MTNPTPLRHGRVYHIYNRGVNRENIFLEKRNYLHFLKLYAQHITPIAYTYAYCLLRNHFHLMVQVKTPEEIRDGENLTGFENLSGLVPNIKLDICTEYNRSMSFRRTKMVGSMEENEKGHLESSTKRPFSFMAKAYRR